MQARKIQVKAKPFILKVLKDKTGVDFSGRVKKSDLTPEVILKIKDAMQFIYRITRGPVDHRCSQVSNAADGRRDELYRKYIPGWTYNHQSTPETVAEFKNHFAQFCTATMGTDNLKELLKTKWAFKGRVNNTTDTLKEKLWYYVTPGAAEPASLAPRSRYTSTDYMDGAEFLKANLKDVFGDNMEIFRGYHQATKKLDRWYIEPDGSLRPNQGDYAAEVVSPPLKADAAMTALRTWYEKARELNFYTNNSTGLHINVSIPDKLDVLKLAVFAGDQYVLKQFGREDNSYARSVIKSLKGQGSLPTVGSDTFKNAEKEMKEMVGRISGDHFATVNFNGKYVSFRHAGGNYLAKPEDIANTVGRFVRAMIIAADPQAYRDEYVQKLVKLMKPEAAATSDKLSLTDIRGIAERGIPVQYIDVVATMNGSPIDAVAAAERYVKENFTGGAGATNIIVQNDPTVRERLLQDRGFSTATKENIQSSPDENFFRVAVYPTTRRSLSGFADRFSTQGTDRGSAFGMYDGQHAKRAVGVRSMSVIKPSDPGYVDAVKALRGEKAKPLPLPGTKAAPKAKAARFASQQPAGQEPEAQQSAQTREMIGVWDRNANRFLAQNGQQVEFDNMPELYHWSQRNGIELGGTRFAPRRIPATIGAQQQAQPSSDDESEPAGSNDDTYTFIRTANREVISREEGISMERAADLAEEYAEYYGETISVYDGNDDLVDQISPNEDGDEEDSNARDMWTLNNGEMVRHYDPSQVNSERAYELAREMYSQYSRPVTISRDGTTYGHWPREEQQADGYSVVDSSNRVIGQTHATEDDALEAAQALADTRRGTYYVNNPNGERVGGARPDESDDGDEDDEQDSAPGRQFYRFMNPSNRNTVATGYYNTDQEAGTQAQRIANSVHGEILLLGVTAVGPDRRLGTFEPETGSEEYYRIVTGGTHQVVARGDVLNDLRVTAQRIADRQNIQLQIMDPDGQVIGAAIVPQGLVEARIFQPSEKVNVVYQPQNSTAKVIVAKAVDHIMANRVIDSYVDRSKKNPNRAPVTAKDFVLNPAKGYTTAEDISSAGGSTTDDSTSPIHGFNEDEMMESYLYSMKRAGYDIL